MAELLKYNGFKYCPSCASEQLDFALKNMRCKKCGYILYLNTAASVGVIIWRMEQGEHQVLLVVRAEDPERSRYDLPGGFADPGESLEEALMRELGEELGEELPEALSSPQYFLSASNNYYYKHNMYPVCDVFFHAELTKDVELIAADDVGAYVWCRVDEIKFEHIAFPSTKQALQCWLESQS